MVCAQPRPQVLPLHTAEAGATANGSTVPTLGYEAVAVQNTIAAAWDGTLAFEVTTDNANWTAVTCRNALSTVTASTVVAAAGYVVCPVTGAQGFRARVSGRTVGTVTAVAALIPMSGSGVISAIPPVGAAATQVQGTANDGAAEVGNPVQVGGVDGGGLMQAFLVGTDGRQDVNVGQVAGQTITAGAGAVAAGTPRTTLASDDPAVVSLSVLDDWDEADRAAVNLITGQVGVQGGSGIVTALTQRTVLATDVALPAGTNLLGKVGIDQTTPGTTNRVDIGTFPDNEPFNVAQINGVVPLMGAGNTGTGSPRVTIATDQVVVPVKQAPGDAPCKTTTINSQGVANAGVVVDATAGGVTVLAASATRCGAVLHNLQGGGDALCAPTAITVTTTVGFYLPAGQSLALGEEAQQAWKCIRQAGVSATFYVAEATP